MASQPIPPQSLGGGGKRLLRGEHGRGFLSSNDAALAKQILATHAHGPDIKDLDVKPLLSIVKDILRLAKPSSTDQVEPHSETLDIQSLSHQDHKVLYNQEQESEIVRLLALPIGKISCETIYKYSDGGDAHSVTMDLLKSLTNYSWDAKVVITFAAFVANYGEFWLVEQSHTEDTLAKHIATLKDLPYVMEHARKPENKFEAILGLFKGVMNIIHCLIEFKESVNISHEAHDAPEAMAMAYTTYIPIAVYWIIRSLLACASTLLKLIEDQAYITSTAESWQKLSLAHKLSVILGDLQHQLAVCKGLVERKKAEEYIEFKRLIERTHTDNMNVLRAMISASDDQRPPLYDGSKWINEPLDVLKAKYVLLLISGLDIREELNVLYIILNQQARTHEFEILWLPIVDPTTAMAWEEKRNSMPWYSVDHPELIEPEAVRYIREDLKFVDKPMLIVLDPHGKPSKADALPMIWIWGCQAFPFTEDQELALWKDETWNMELLADFIDPRIQEWMTSNRVVCLYGGEDMEWIRKFTRAARAVAAALQVPLEMLYVGKRNPSEQVRRCHEAIDREKLSHVFHPTEYHDYVWYFWVRLWSMWNSKKQVGMTVDTDPIMQHILDILTFDSNEKGWAAFSRGNHEITKAKGEVLLPVMDNYAAWANKVDHPDKFVSVLDEEIRQTHPDHHCNRLILPLHGGYVPDHVVCTDCGRTMDKYLIYRCGTD